MTRKDYVAIAAAIYAGNPTAASIEYTKGGRDYVRLVAIKISDVMAQDNPRFDRERFLKACGVQA